MSPFLLNDSVLVLATRSVTLGALEFSGIDLLIRGETQRTAARIRYDRYTHWLEPFAQARPVLHNRRIVNRPVPIQPDDEIYLGQVVLRVPDPCPQGLSPVFEFVGRTGAIQIGSRRDIHRFVLLQQHLVVASRPPCHVGVAGLGSDVLEIGFDDGLLVCRSMRATSVLTAKEDAVGSWIHPISIPGQLIIRPPDRDLGVSDRAPVRLSFQVP